MGCTDGIGSPRVGTAMPTIDAVTCVVCRLASRYVRGEPSLSAHYVYARSPPTDPCLRVHQAVGLTVADHLLRQVLLGQQNHTTDYVIRRKQQGAHTVTSDRVAADEAIVNPRDDDLREWHT